ncbi:hypothetical protein GSI_04359 [Ganoderma sinense ZZ0214-1]|uniref:F-box domain-containing protein n=1 Tax=Ganoderma sinense ZZ0214-1 TaxID=1077348 RepID=A0A2G8SIY7_9APHY|nr:hypothetical protein GSI_04359 [Ganoderma sinense ZZ0214-1]
MDLRARLAVLHERADTLRLRAFRATTLWQDLMNMRCGLSHEMARVIRDARAVRARISAVSYVELQNVQLRTIDGKEVAQLRYEVLLEPMLDPTSVSDSALFAGAASAEFDSASRNDKDALALLDDVSRKMQKARDATTLLLHRAEGKLRRFRNSFINLNSLPDELLLSIFQHACGRELELKFNVIDVCGRWRDLCLAHPEFWADFNARPFPRNGIARAFKYSRTHPVCVHICHDDENKARKLIFANAQSVERLDVHIRDPTGQRKNVWLDRNWPVLRVLEFQSFNPSNIDAIALPISGRVDKLRALTLQDVRFPYFPQHYRHLRFLKIISNCYDNDYRSGGPREGSLFDALRGSPNLEVLMLKDPPMPVDPVLLPRGAEAQPLHLPRVQTLKLVLSTQKAFFVLRHLRTSPTVLQHAEVITHRWRVEPYSDYGATDTRPIHDIDKKLLLDLPSPDNLPLLASLRSLSIRFCDYQRISGSFEALDDAFARWIGPYDRSTSAGYTVDMEHEPPLNFNIEYRVVDGTYYDADTLTAPTFDNFIRSVFRHYGPYEEMRVLRIDQGLSTQPLLAELHRVMPRVRTVVLHKCVTVGDVLNAILAVGSTFAVGEDEDREVLPELATVVLVKCVVTAEDAAKLSETVKRLRLHLVVVRAPKEEIESDDDWGKAKRKEIEEAERVWREAERVLIREEVDMEVRVIRPNPSLIDDSKWWYKRFSEPYEQ